MSTAQARFLQLDSERSAMLSRFERLSELTVPSVLPQDEHSGINDQLTNGASSLGAVAVNHLVNKMMLAMFRAGQPFFRLELPPAEKAKIAEAVGIDEGKLLDVTSAGERAAMRQLEVDGARAVLFEVLTHLVVIGNTMIELGDELRQYNIRDYVVRRARSGKVVELLTREVVLAADLSREAQTAILAHKHLQWDTEVTLYRWCRYVDGMYRMSTWADEVLLPTSFAGRWKPETFPFRVLTWRLPNKQDYGIGRVEEVANDLATHESLAEALADGAALASTFRWVVNPGGITRAEELTGSPNGGTLPGSKDDITLVFAAIGTQLQTVQGINEEFTRRIGQSFLLNSAITRDAERVTAQELRLQVMELETNMGGAYSQLGGELQQPLARWLLKKAGFKIEGTKIAPTVVTGLDALSRNADLENVKLFLQDIAGLDTLSPATKYNLKLNAIISQFAAGRGIERATYVNSEAEAQALQQRDLEMQAQAQALAASGPTQPETTP